MLEILFVIGFFVVLLFTGISLIGIAAALMIALCFMLFAGLFTLVIKLLPWLLLAIVAAWIYRSLNKPKKSEPFY